MYTSILELVNIPLHDFFLLLMMQKATEQAVAVEWTRWLNGCNGGLIGRRRATLSIGTWF
jgi:hypothetical protein